MLQNRADPYGAIIKTSARGAWMGNRGLIHNEHQQIVRPFRLKAWITCLLQFKGWHRKVMTPGRYTELFFTDEATAFAAGHRPCAECRRAAYDLFKRCWLKGNPGHGFTLKTSIKDIDMIMHSERMDTAGKKITYTASLKTLPDGTFILWDDKPHLLVFGKLFEWHPAGYAPGIPLPAIRTVTVLTPLSLVNTIKAGYTPQWAMLGGDHE